MIPLANANSSTAPLIYMTMKGKNRMPPQHTDLNVSVSIPLNVSTYSLPLLPPLHISIPPPLHFDRWPILAPMHPSPQGPTLLHTIPYRSRARIPPDTLLSLLIRLRALKRSPVLVLCPWIPRLLVAPPLRSLPTFLLPSPATFLWKISPLSLPIPRFVCDRLSHPSLVFLSTVLTHRGVNAIHQNLRLSLHSSKIRFL